ncbi:MAG: hypothetical protein GF313_07285 [Caldithrix sp.]|nr:hypothetical protein [Caldithrix sp.]
MVDNHAIKILFVRLSSIGDILLTTPLIRQTRISFPAATIDYITKPQFYELIKFNPHLNTIHNINPHGTPKELSRQSRALKQNEYDFVFDLHNNFRSRLLTFHLKGSKIGRMKKNKIKRALLVYTKINLFHNILSIPDKYSKVAAMAGIQDDGLGLEIFWKDYIENQVHKKLSRLAIKQNFVAMAPGAGFYTKRWPIDYFKKLIRAMLHNNPKKQILILGGPDEASQFKTLQVKGQVFNLAGSLSLLESAIVVSQAELLISNDSGIMHMATAVNTPVLAIFGSTVRELGFYPYRGQHKVLENGNLSCRPCSHIGRKQCPLRHFKCMKEIYPEKVMQEMSNLYQVH